MGDIPPLRGRMLNALRSVAVSPGGLRLSAHPSSMPKLVEMGLIEERTLRLGFKLKGWFLTEAGRKAIRASGLDEVRREP